MSTTNLRRGAVDTPDSGALTASARNGTTDGASPGLSVRRLNVMRIGFAVMGIGIAARNWPLIIGRDEPWPLFEGVTKYMLVAMGLLALLGLRYPVRMLPILLFESAWKLLWLGAIAVPLWLRDGMDTRTSEVAGSVLLVVIILAVIPWGYVFRQYMTKPGDAWRSRGAAQAGKTS